MEGSSAMESAVGSSEANPICLLSDDSSEDDEEKPAESTPPTRGNEASSSPSKRQGDKNRLLGQLHTERLARQANEGAKRDDQQKPSALAANPGGIVPVSKTNTNTNFIAATNTNTIAAITMKRVRGDLIGMALKGCFDVILHGCNCQNALGAGIALSIKKEFPEAYAADCKTSQGDRNKLGTISTATVRRSGRDITIVNAYTQYHWRGQGVLTDYDALRSAFREVKSQFAGSRIGYPKIGAGLAKGNWIQIELIICEELAGEDHCLVEYQPSKRK